MTLADLWTIMPLLILAAGSLVVLLLGAIVPGRYGTAVGLTTLAGAALWALQSPPAALAQGLGIAFTPFARFFTAFFCLTGAAAFLLSHDHCQRRGLEGEEYPATLLFAVFGMAALACAGNLLVLFLGLEALTFAFYILVAYDRTRPASAEAGLKYLLLGAVSAAFTAFGIAFLYTATGSLALHLPAAGQAGPLLLTGWGFLLAGLAFKVSLVPAHLWTPDVYQGAPTPVAAFLASGSKGAAVAFLLLVLPAAGDVLRVPLWGLAFLSMTVGNLAALRQTSIRRLLAYSSIGQMGYVALALLAGPGEGLQAAVFYVVVYALMILAAFGVISSLAGDDDLDEIVAYRGLGCRHPFQAGVLAVTLFSLAGIPPTAGFTGKFLIFAAALRAGETVLAVVGILTAAVSAYYYLRVVVNLFLHPSDQPTVASPPTWREKTVLAVIAMFLLAGGIYPAPLLYLLSEIMG